MKFFIFLFSLFLFSCESSNNSRTIVTTDTPRTTIPPNTDDKNNKTNDKEGQIDIKVSKSIYFDDKNLNGKLNCSLSTSDTFYICGDFSQIGGVAVNKVAFLHNNTWHKLEEEVNTGTIKTLYYTNGTLYIGGKFNLKNSNGETIDNIAYYKNGKLYPLKNGVNDEVNAITSDGINIFIGGRFSEIDNKSGYSIAKWDGTNLTQLGSGLNQKINADIYPAEITSLAFYNNKLYASGVFNNSNNKNLNGIAVFDTLEWKNVINMNIEIIANKILLDSSGSLFFAGHIFSNGLYNYGLFSFKNNILSKLNNSLDGVVETFSIEKSKLHAITSFYDNTGKVYRKISSSDIGSGAWVEESQSINGEVSGIDFFESNIIISGNFLSVSNNPYTAYLAVKKNGTWGGLNNLQGKRQIYGTVNDVAISDEDSFYLAGKFDIIGDSFFNNISLYKNGEFTKLGNGLNGEVKTIAYDKNIKILYAAGYFTSADGKQSNSMAYWDGNNWYPINTDDGEDYFSGQINKIVFDGSNDLIVGGSFDKIGSISSSNIAKLTKNKTFSSMDGGLDNTVEDIIFTPFGLFAGGQFNRSSKNTLLHYITEWKNGSWRQVSSTIIDSDYSYVKSLKSNGNDTLYIGGMIDSIGGSYCNGLATLKNNVLSCLFRVDDDKIGEIYNSVDGIVYDVKEDSLIMYGDFELMNGFSANGTAKATGGTVYDAGQYFDGRLLNAVPYGDKTLYYGYFKSAGNVKSSGIALGKN